MITETKTSIKSSDAAKLRVGVLCIDVDPAVFPSLEVMVAQTPGAHVVDNVDPRIVAREVTRMLERFQYRVCIIDFDTGVEACCRIVEQLRSNCDNSINLIGTSSDSNVETVIAAMRSGCSEFLPKPFDPDRVTAALVHIMARRHVKGENGGLGRVVTLIGAKGGSGVTSLTLQLALNLARRDNQKCVVVDQHPALGDVSLYLGLTRHQYSFYELVHNTDRLDEELLQGFVLTHESGLHVLDSPDAVDHFAQSDAEALEHTLSFLAGNYQYVLIDCPPGITPDSGAAIRQSDRVAIVITPELPAVRNAARMVEYLVGMHYPENCIDILLNRHAKNNLLTDEEIEAALRRPIAMKIPNNYGEFARAINAGTPLLPGRNAKLSLAFDDWANRLMGEQATVAAETSETPTWLQRLGF
jgi:pilus assembly protein CpaE